MRNDARPVGVDAHDQSPVASDHVPGAPLPPRDRDHRDGVAHDRQSHIVNEGAEPDEQPRGNNRGGVAEDPTMPTGDSSLNTKI